MRTFGAARHDVRRWFRWSSREGALAPDRIETPPAQGGGQLTRSRYARWRSLLDPRIRAASRRGLDTLAGARYSTTEYGLPLGEVSIRSLALATRPPNQRPAGRPNTGPNSSTGDSEVGVVEEGAELVEGEVAEVAGLEAAEDD